ncbi:MAG: ECF transporter S component [Oscillospiraceae bacterium]|jgi:riboflavin transporter FmnP|nr:ECF transporter S component [Oscillospiraceae bacterium]
MKRTITLRTAATVAMLAAISAVLMFLEFPLVFFFPEFLKLDFSDLPALIGAFAFGPIAGVTVELLKNLIHLTVTSTGGVGELANFLVGVALVVPAGLVYTYRKKRSGALLGIGLGVAAMVVIGALANYFLIIPFYSNLFPLQVIIDMCAALVPAVDSLWKVILLTIIPFNLMKGALIGIITFFAYKRLSRLLHGKQ